MTAIAGVFTVAWIVCMCCLWESIGIGTAVVQVSGEFVSKNSRIVWGPVVSFLLSIPVLVWWILTCVYVYSIG